MTEGVSAAAAVSDCCTAGRACSVSAAAPSVMNTEKMESMIRFMCLPILEIECHTESDREDVDLEVHHAGVALADRNLIVYLLGVRIGDTHYADVYFDGHVVRREGHDAGRNAEREGVAGFVGALHRGILGEARLRAASGQLHFVEEREAFVASQRNANRLC